MIRKYVAGVGSLLALMAILVGVPFVLIVAAGNPLPNNQQLDSILTLTPDYGNIILVSKVLPMIGWVAWAFFAIPMLIEIVAAIVGRTTPKQSAAFRTQQHLAATLLAAVFVMFAGTGVLTSPVLPASAALRDISSSSPTVAPASPRPLPATVVQRIPVDFALAGTSSVSAPQTKTVTHAVVPGDTLWDLAEHYYGDGTRYVDIYHATTGTVQTDGSHLTDPNLIRPGWVLTVPGVPTPAVPSAVRPPPTAHPQTPIGATPPHTPDHDPGGVSQETRAPGMPSSAERLPTPTTAPQSSPAAETADDGMDLSIPLMTGGGIAGLLAAGLLIVVDRRRRVQRRSRVPGARIAMPELEGVEFESQLRMIQDPVCLEHVDTALRTLQMWAENTSGVLPDVFAVRLEAEEIALYLGAPAHLPMPFTCSHNDHTIWTIRTAALGASPADTLAPYPALTTIGVDTNNGVLLLNLEHLGAVNILGDDSACRSFLNAIAVELASSPWADQIQITMLGMPDQLARSLNPSRVHQSNDIVAVLRNLDHDLDDRRSAFASLSVNDTRHARATVAGTESWAPHILLVAEPLEPDARRTLREMANSNPNLGLVVLAHGTTDNDWPTVSLTAVDRAELLLPGRSIPALPFQPQILQHRELDLLQQLVDTAARSSRPADYPAATDPNRLEHTDTTLAERADVEQASEAHFIVGTEPDQRAREEPGSSGWSAPYLRLLGPLDILRVGDEAAMPRRGIELVAYLNLNGPVDGRQMQMAFWPDTAQASNNQRQLAKKVRVALGHTLDGMPLLPENTQRHGYQLDSAIRSDWDDFRALTGNDPATAATEALVEALRLVRGQPFANCNTRRWWHWIAVPEEEMIAAVLDTANELASRALTAHDLATARFAAHIAQTADPLNEAGWRIQLRIAARTGDRAEFDRILDDLYTRLGSDDPDYELDDITQQLVDQYRTEKATTV